MAVRWRQAQNCLIAKAISSPEYFVDVHCELENDDMGFLEAESNIRDRPAQVIRVKFVST